MFPEQHRITKQITHLFITAQKSECQIRPHFFLTGPTGSGKSFLVNQVAEELNFPFFEINAAQLTAEGLSGNSLSKAMRPLRQLHRFPRFRSRILRTSTEFASSFAISWTCPRSGRTPPPKSRRRR